MKLNICKIKEIVSELKRPPTEWEKIFAKLYIRQGTYKQNIQGAQKLKLPQNQ
jgi:hypothetical protein